MNSMTLLGGLISLFMFPTLQATQNPFYLHVGSHILESLEKHSRAEYVSVYTFIVYIKAS